jgi:hypothetical protein
MKGSLPHAIRRVLFRVLLALVVCVTVAGIAWLVLPSSKSPSLENPLPSPNGHDDFVAAGQSLAGSGFDWRAAPIEQVHDYVSSNATALSRLRLGLPRPARVPIQFTRYYSGQRLDELSSTKRLALLLLAEGKVSEADQRLDDALRSYFDALRFSQESVRGGLLIDMLVGVACERLALDSLERVLGALDPPQCRRAIQVIQDLERVREPTAVILAREQAWSRRVMGWPGKILRIMPGHAQSLRQAEQKAASKRDQADRHRGAVLIKLACRAFKLEAGKGPGRWEDLVPRYLEKIPTDPSTGQPLPLDLVTGD